MKDQKKIIEILSNYTDVEPDQISLDSNLVADLGFTSLDVLDMVSEFEDEYNIEIQDREIKQMKTVRDIVVYLTENA
ncbi:acyl carrier protein [Firmicutes bacterium M10-2]|nr:acyl carrier protein [Firmicutes bacterium M10-2]